MRSDSSPATGPRSKIAETIKGFLDDRYFTNKAAFAVELTPDDWRVVRAALSETATPVCELEEARQILQKACDRTWKDETLYQTAVIASNAIYWRDREIENLKRDRDARAREACTAEGRTGCSFAPSARALNIEPLSQRDVELLSRLSKRLLTLRQRLEDTQLADTQEITKEIHALDWAVARIARTA